MNATDGRGPVDRDVGPLLPCPCCGASDGYRLTEGTTYRWWHVECAACGQEFGECRSDRRRTPALLTRHRFADEHWNEIAAHADRLRAERDADAKLLRWVLRTMASKRRNTGFFWGDVRDAFGLGSTSAAALCRRFGLDPDTGKELAPNAQAQADPTAAR
jgi:phage terminase large subunit GpA-like protein